MRYSELTKRQQFITDNKQGYVNSGHCCCMEPLSEQILAMQHWLQHVCWHNNMGIHQYSAPKQHVCLLSSMAVNCSVRKKAISMSENIVVTINSMCAESFYKRIWRHIRHIPLFHDPTLNNGKKVHTSDLMMIVRQSVYSLNHFKGNG